MFGSICCRLVQTQNIPPFSKVCFNSAGTSPASLLPLSSLLLAQQPFHVHHYSQRRSSSVSKSAAALAPPHRACLHSPVAPLSTLCNDHIRYYVLSPVGRTLVHLEFITAAANPDETLKLRLFPSVFHQEKKSFSPLKKETGSICRQETLLITAALPTAG